MSPRNHTSMTAAANVLSLRRPPSVAVRMPASAGPERSVTVVREQHEPCLPVGLLALALFVTPLAVHFLHRIV